MLERFVKGKEYIFDQRLANKHLHNPDDCEWMYRYDGYVVEPVSNYVGKIESDQVIYVAPEWCRIGEEINEEK